MKKQLFLFYTALSERIEDRSHFQVSRQELNHRQT
jgi:hypothetical protein